MSKRLGKIKKPPADEYREGRKLYCISLLFAIKDAAKEYSDKYELYWNQVAEHVNGLEKAGKISKIYHEGIFLAGKEGLQAIKQMNEKSYQLVKSKCDQGAQLQALEDTDLFGEYVDWLMCLSVVGRSQNVVIKILEFYEQASKKRDEHVTKLIDQTLDNSEAGMLIMSDEYRMHIQPQLPSDIQVFLVSPPALHDIQRLIREMLSRQSST